MPSVSLEFLFMLNNLSKIIEILSMEAKTAEKSENPSTDEEELDIRSENFNPLKAIYSKKLKAAKDVKKFDNVAVSIKLEIK